MDDELFDLLDQMFIIDHSERITAKEAILHPFFDDVRSTIEEIEMQK